jgi:colicin import membrane protein
MKVLTLPKAAAALEYRALRLPATLLENQVARFLAEDSAVRLGFEKVLGTVDEKAGALLGNDTIASRGHALRRRSEILGKAVELETKAQIRKAAAAAKLEAGKKAAEKTREQAKRAAREGVQETLRTEQERKKHAEQEADARLQAETERVEAETRAKTQAVEAQLDAQERRIDETTKARTAAPKAQLSNAVAEKKAATDERAKADRLAKLADAEKESRKAARG